MSELITPAGAGVQAQPCHRSIAWAFIDNGQLAALGTPDTLKADLGGHAVEYASQGGYDVRYFADRAAALNAVAEGPQNVHIREVSLEDVFLKFTGRKLETGADV